MSGELPVLHFSDEAIDRAAAFITAMHTAEKPGAEERAA